MKKLLASILAVIYLSTSMGATMHFHYCMDKLVSWGLGTKATNKKSCPYCGMSKSSTDKHCSKVIKGCCKDGQKQIKVENDQKVTETSIYLAQTPAKAIIHTFSDYSFEYVCSLTEEYPVTHAPPRTANVPLFVRNCVFRI